MALDAPPLGLENKIHLHLCWPDKITDEALLRRYRSLLSQNELEQMERFYFARHRHQHLVTRALVRTTLSSHFGVEPSRWEFLTNAYGKPHLGQPHESLPVRFNISHTDGLIILGITRRHEIGVDVEDRQRSTRAALESLSSYFSKQEIYDLQRLPADQQKQRFFDYWTLKESYIKARGKGLSIPLDKFSFHFENNVLSEFRVDPALEDDAGNWQFWQTPVAARYQIAVALNSPTKAFQLTPFNTIPLVSSETIDLPFS